MGKDNWPTIIAAAAFLLQFIGTIVAGIKSLAKLETNLREAINEASKYSDLRIDQQARDFGEVVVAMRQKIQDVELYVRDRYVTQETFMLLNSELKTGIEKLGDRLEQGVRRLEEKIEESNG